MAAFNVFSPCDGTVALYKTQCPQTGDTRFLSVSVAGENLYDKGLITGLSVALAGNYQFLHTVNNFIYLYAFGDRISTLNITGLGFVKPCQSAQFTQVQNIYQFYKTNRVAQKTQPLNIVINSTSAGDPASALKFIGYLTGMNIDLKNSDPTGTIGFWNMKFDVVMDTSGGSPPPPAGPTSPGPSFGAGGRRIV